MIVQKGWAVYHDGHLQLLDPMDLSEGQRVQVTIMSERDEVKAALGDLLVEMLPAPEMTKI